MEYYSTLYTQEIVFKTRFVNVAEISEFSRGSSVCQLKQLTHIPQRPCSWPASLLLFQIILISKIVSRCFRGSVKSNFQMIHCRGPLHTGPGSAKTWRASLVFWFSLFNLPYLHAIASIPRDQGQQLSCFG